MAASMRKPRAPRNDAKASAPQPKPATVDNVIGDVRDRIKANGIEDWGTGVAQLASYADHIDTRARDALALGNEPHHLDASVACDFRETMLAIATFAVAAVVEHDRRALGARAVAT